MGYCYDVNIVYSEVWKMGYGYDVNIVNNEVWKMVYTYDVILWFGKWAMAMMLTLLILRSGRVYTPMI